MRSSSNNLLKKFISVLLIISFIILSVYFLDAEGITRDIDRLLSKPAILLFIFFSYASAFLARGIAWKLYLRNRVRLSTCMYGLFYSLLLNHLLPVKAGDFARIGILKMKEPEVPSGEAFNSVVILRLLDTGILIGMALTGLVFLDLPVNGNLLYWIGAGGIGIILILLTRFRHLLYEQYQLLLAAFKGTRGILVILLTFMSWVLEAGIIYGVILNSTSDFDFLRAIWVNSITVAGQIFQMTPGGIASYEAVMLFALGAVGIEPGIGYSAALITHGIKYVFTFIVGGVALFAAPVPINKLKKWIKERGRKS